MNLNNSKIEWISGKIYKTAILYSGKKPSFKAVITMAKLLQPKNKNV
jgi:hypothetical protein